MKRNMNKKEEIRMSVSFASREPGPWTKEEWRQLANFFMILMEWQIEEDIKKEQEKIKCLVQKEI